MNGFPTIYDLLSLRPPPIRNCVCIKSYVFIVLGRCVRYHLLYPAAPLHYRTFLNNSPSRDLNSRPRRSADCVLFLLTILSGRRLVPVFESANSQQERPYRVVPSGRDIIMMVWFMMPGAIVPDR